MNWQFIFSALGILFLLCLVFVTFFTRKKLGWVGAIRLSILMFAMIGIFTLLSALLVALPESHPFLYKIILLISLFISIIALVYTTWQWCKFFLIFRKAGRIASSISHTNFEFRWFMGMFTLVVSFWTFDIDHPKFYLMWMGCIFLSQALRDSQYRQNGIVYKISFIPWESIASLSWKTEYSKETLNLHFKTSSEIIPLILPYQNRQNILNFIQLKLPTQFAQANPPPIAQPTQQTNQLSYPRNL